MNNQAKPFNFRAFFGFTTDQAGPAASPAADSSGCGSGSNGCGGGCSSNSNCSIAKMKAAMPPMDTPPAVDAGRPLSRRQAFQAAATGLAAVGVAGCSNGDREVTKEERDLQWQEQFKKNYRVMTPEEQQESIERLTKLAKIRYDRDITMKGTPAQPNVLYGYAFNISRCEGYRDCVQACVEENNLDREANTHYIRIFEMENGKMDVSEGNTEYVHQVPAEGHFYMGTQCFQCANPPCVEVCPVGATWQEPDGITVIDYDWCIGCRYCQAACPYWARRFNWAEPVVPAEEINPNQHYLGNRMRKKGCVEKCTFCIQRSRSGKLPACVEACPTGARVFGNLLDPDSEIRYVLANKKVFRLKEDLGTDPKFWYFMD